MTPNYDDSAFSFFALTFGVLYLLVALTLIGNRYRRFASKGGKGAASDANVKGRTEAETRKLRAMAADVPEEVLYTPQFKAFLAITGVVALFTAFFMWRVYSTPSLAAYDPYAILGIPTGAEDREIKRAYRKLSLENHPDKGGSAEAFEKISKAYQALSDPEARKNWEEFGNPDGKQPLEVGIGMPSFLLGDSAKWLFVGAYLFVLVVLVPAVMCMCYRRWKAGRDIHPIGLHKRTIGWLNARLSHDITPAALAEIYAGCEEFAPLCAAIQADPEMPRLSQAVSERAGPVPMMQGMFNRIPALVLLLVHLTHPSEGLTILSPHLRIVQREIIAKWDLVTRVMLMICMEKQEMHRMQPHMQPNSYVGAASVVMAFSAMMVQGFGLLPPGDKTGAAAPSAANKGKSSSWVTAGSSLRLLFSEKMCATLRNPQYPGGWAQRRGQPMVTTLLQYLRLGEAEKAAIREMLTDEERRDLDAIVPCLPNLDVSVSVATEGEDCIAEGDVVTATVTLTHLNMPADGPANATVPSVYCPRMPLEVSESWQVTLFNSSGEQQALDLAVPRKREEELKLKFGAPRAGTHTYRLVLQSPQYLGLDQMVEVPFDVRPAAEVAKPKRARAEDDEEEEEESAPDVIFEKMLGMGRSNVDDSDCSDDEAGEPSREAVVRKALEIRAEKAKAAKAAGGSAASGTGAGAAASSGDAGAEESGSEAGDGSADGDGDRIMPSIVPQSAQLRNRKQTKEEKEKERRKAAREAAKAKSKAAKAGAGAGAEAEANPMAAGAEEGSDDDE